MSRRHGGEIFDRTSMKVLLRTFFALVMAGAALCEEAQSEPSQELPKGEPLKAEQPKEPPKQEQAKEPAKEPAKTMRDVQAYFKECLQPFHEADGAQINIYFSVRRDGRIYGRPRVVWFSPRDENADDRHAILGDFLRSFEACTPLQLSPLMAESIPGKVYYLQFNGSADGAKVIVRPFGSEGPPLIDDWWR
jgi:hypothetical protein